MDDTFEATIHETDYGTEEGDVDNESDEIEDLECVDEAGSDDDAALDEPKQVESSNGTSSTVKEDPFRRTSQREEKREYRDHQRPLNSRYHHVESVSKSSSMSNGRTSDDDDDGFMDLFEGVGEDDMRKAVVEEKRKKEKADGRDVIRNPESHYRRRSPPTFSKRREVKNWRGSRLLQHDHRGRREELRHHSPSARFRRSRSRSRSTDTWKKEPRRERRDSHLHRERRSFESSSIPRSEHGRRSEPELKQRELSEGREEKKSLAKKVQQRQSSPRSPASSRIVAAVDSTRDEPPKTSNGNGSHLPSAEDVDSSKPVETEKKREEPHRTVHKRITITPDRIEPKPPSRPFRGGRGRGRGSGSFRVTVETAPPRTPVLVLNTSKPREVFVDAHPPVESRRIVTANYPGWEKNGGRGRFIGGRGASLRGRVPTRFA